MQFPIQCDLKSSTSDLRSEEFLGRIEAQNSEEPSLLSAARLKPSSQINRRMFRRGFENKTSTASDQRTLSLLYRTH